MTSQHLGFIFPGQGSQAKGMLTELVTNHAVVKSTFSEASSYLGFDLWSMITQDDGGQLDLTRNTQPALLTCSVATWRLWNERGGAMPAIMAGHSLGEYSALVCAGALEFAEAVTLVADRGKFMQEAVAEGTGAMAAILGLDDEVVIGICEAAAGSDTVSAANFNSAGQVVIAGHKTAVDRALELAKDRGAKRTMILPVSVPSHCQLMAPAAEKLAARLEQVNMNDARVPVVQNVDARPRTRATDIRQALVEQLCQSVHWWKSVHGLRDGGVSSVVECGPGKVLSGLIKRIDRDITTFPLHDTNTFETALNGINP